MLQEHLSTCAFQAGRRATLSLQAYAAECAALAFELTGFAGRNTQHAASEVGVMYLPRGPARKMQELVSIDKEDVLVVMAPSEEAVIVDEPLHSTDRHCHQGPMQEDAAQLCRPPWRCKECRAVWHFQDECSAAYNWAQQWDHTCP